MRRLIRISMTATVLAIGGTAAIGAAGASAHRTASPTLGPVAHADIRKIPQVHHGSTARRLQRRRQSRQRSYATVIGSTRRGAARQATDPTAMIARVLAMPCQGTGLMPDAANLPAVRQAVLCLVNQERARHGLSPLKTNSALQRAAQGHAAEMVADDYFEHTAPDGESPLQRIRANGYIPDASVGYVIGENLAWGTLTYATPAQTVDAWLASPEHLANILNPRFTETAVGVVPEAIPSRSGGQPGAVYAQEFGVIEG